MNTREQFEAWCPPTAGRAHKAIAREGWDACAEVSATEITRLTDEVKRLREALENSTDLVSIMEQQFSIVERRGGQSFGIDVAQDEPARQWQLLDERATRLRKSTREALKESQ